jgi:hypothetical protein
MFSSNCVFDLLTQSTQFDFTVRCFVLTVFPQRSVFLTYTVANLRMFLTRLYVGQGSQRGCSRK